MDDSGLPFDEAKAGFQVFLSAQGWPTELLWLTRDRIVGCRRSYWVLRPEELAADGASRAFYEAVRRTPRNLRLDAVARLGDRTLAVVEDQGGPSRMLNFGILHGWRLRPVRSRITWAFLRAASRLWGGTPYLRCSRITGTEESAEQLGAAAARFGARRPWPLRG